MQTDVMAINHWEYNRDGRLIEKDKELEYEGGLNKHNKYHGKGRLSVKNSVLYKGDFVNGRKEGKGVEVDTEKQYRYEGEFRNDNKNGIGSLRLFNGDKYIGYFNGNLKHGQGQYTFKNGDIYEGMYRCDKRHGYVAF